MAALMNQREKLLSEGITALTTAILMLYSSQIIRTVAYEGVEPWLE